MKLLPPAQVQPVTRVRLIRVPNPRPRCFFCGVVITAFNNGRGRCVVVNVYRKRRWQEVRLYHHTCYQDIGEPFGPAIEAIKVRQRRVG